MSCSLSHREIAQNLNLLGILFSIDPADPQFTEVLNVFQQPELAAELHPDRNDDISEIALAMRPAAGERFDINALHAAHGALLAGPEPLQAPPWGSVYLDPEHLLYGASTIALQEFLREESVVIEGRSPGPEDHFGSLCWLGAWFASEDRMDSFDTLMGEHILPWAFAYLDQFERASRQVAESGNRSAGFYAGSARFARMTLKAVQDARCIAVMDRKAHAPNTLSP